ncbi:MAG TPA: cyanophycin synthetase [Flavisolibacter sp.]
MKVIDIKVLRGPNYWSIKRHKLIQMTLDIEEMEQKPTNEIPGFYERLQNLLPSLYEHRCSEGVPGGFFNRVQEGTWIGHVVEHIALEIQSLAGIDAGFGRVRGAGKEGVYHVVFSYGEEKEGVYAAHAAIRIAQALVDGQEYDLQKDIDMIRDLWEDQKLGPSTGSLVDEAIRRNIPALRLDNNALVQLGYGRKQKLIEATITSNTSQIAVDIAGNKNVTKRILTEVNVPVPRGVIVSSVENLAACVDEVGFPLVIKPLDGNHGKGATINITSYEEAEQAFHRAKKYSHKIIVESFITGHDYRILLVNYKFIAAALRTPASVTGDGVHTISQLVEIANSDPKRGRGHCNVLTTIEVNELTYELLNKSGLTMDSVPEEGREIYLKPTANLSTGGTATDVTDEVHPANIAMFERVARTIGLDICGIDVMATDLSTPIKENGGAIIEVNAAPGFRMHVEPTVGTPRNVAKPVMDMLFPFNDDGRIPIVGVTGTNGKTTTSRLVAHIAQHSGYTTGLTTTDGIYINQELLVTGDCSGPKSAQFILRDKCVDFAVLETARGGLLRSGLAFDQCNCAIVTNVAEDHLGLGGIDTIEKLARVKSIVPESVSKDGFAILNADDDLVYAMRENLECNIALFSMYHDNLRIEKHCEAGGLAAIYEQGYILLRQGNQLMPVEEVVNIPITFGGKADFNIANVMAACLAAYTNGITLNTIRLALKTFIPSVETTPGRLNMFDFNDFKVMLDYAHNPHGLRALGKFVRSFDVSRRIGVITGVGDRRDEDIIAVGEEAARIFDEVIIRLDEDLRGRTEEELIELLRKGVQNIDRNKPIAYTRTECEGTEYAIDHATPNSLIVILVDNVQKIQEHIKNCLKTKQLQVSSLKQAI